MMKKMWGICHTTEGLWESLEYWKPRRKAQYPFELKKHAAFRLRVLKKCMPRASLEIRVNGGK